MQEQPLTRAERRRLKREQKKLGKQKETKKRVFQLWFKRIFITIVLIGLAAGFWWWSSSQLIYPPTTIEGHIEEIPEAHILDKPMPLAVQKHMLEHADGKGKPGVVINYNCQNYQCEPDLIEKLAKIVQDYNFVYLAPFPNMDAKIALTKLGQLEVLENFDDNKIRSFIEGR